MSFFAILYLFFPLPRRFHTSLDIGQFVLSLFILFIHFSSLKSQQFFTFMSLHEKSWRAFNTQKTESYISVYLYLTAGIVLMMSVIFLI
ncbi:MAG TPA: hypothetical protein DCY48_00390 [Candidatus Magasanikbacteria bacterium]|nr:MAG: hypothetical protein A3I74_02710 [Candidatus Magasanikbacteria bacterium RIFCSPLOWO2_02_FULL_47_16]OGH79593.1 MAG: hypothetical protein A3C10_00690 [Candidatus Magasanikbacteria bacterium RIFCSPHIGHO2_02_FULL_48_18]OGH82833.1 MAG: hypothetical protein A3G08_02865 [Candidatus Magasanikbacteria bacterium RIFCSPLOWO2_12_FULL_47_9b]HAZ28226.1 hypothetical protein [Candidatus Magasanikbacteria bacterium]